MDDGGLAASSVTNKYNASENTVQHYYSKNQSAIIKKNSGKIKEKKKV